MCRVRSFAERTPVDIFRFRCEILSAVRAKDRLAQMVGHAERSTGRYPESVGSGSTIIGKGRRFKKKYQETTQKKKGKSTAGRKDGASLFQTIELNISQF